MERDEAEALYIENQGLVYSFLKKYFPYLLYDEDAQQWCRIGLWRSCLAFNKDVGIKFSPYAYNGMRGYLKNHYITPTFYKKNGGSGFNTKYPVQTETPISFDTSNVFQETDVVKGLHEFVTGTRDVADDFCDLEDIASNMPEIDRKIFFMRLAGYTSVEIGNLLHRTRANIDQHIKFKIKPIVLEQLELESV